jgi:hypothetical protein
MCTGGDCTDEWKIAHCKKESSTCSNDPGTGNLICSCIKKAAKD